MRREHIATVFLICLEIPSAICFTCPLPLSRGGLQRCSFALKAKKGIDPLDPRNAFAQSPQAAPNFKSNEKEYDPRSTWKESGESLSAEIKKANPSARAAIPDAITQTDNSAKRSQNAQMRQRQLDADEPEALKKMRLEREEREKREQEAKDAAAAADAKLRAETGNFVSGQDLREARMSDAYELEQKNLGSAGSETGPDIRQKVRAMQGAARRMRADKERLQHQSMKSGKTLAEVAAALTALLNDKMPEALGEIVMRWSEVISAAATKANAFMNGSFRVPRAQVLSMTSEGLTLSADIVTTGFFGNEKASVERVEIKWAGGRSVKTDDDVKEALMDMLRGCGRDAETAILLQAPGIGSIGWQIPDNLFLNEVPCDADIRDWFYRDICDAVEVALGDTALLSGCKGRLKVECSPPELNPEMDTFRSGTMLELVRELAIRVAVVMNKRVKVCIQGSLGEGIFTGMPLMLSGMRKTLESMDWQSGEGQLYQGILVDDMFDRRTGQLFVKGNPNGLIAFGEVDAWQVASEDEVFIIIAPQSMVGASVYEPLAGMVKAANGRPVVLINPRLKDRPSSGSLMSVGGRSERIAFAKSFVEIYHFRLLFKGSQFMFPIRGALRYNVANSKMWTVFERDESRYEGVDPTDQNMQAEFYRPLAVFPSEPDPAVITQLIQDDVRKQRATLPQI